MNVNDSKFAFTFVVGLVLFDQVVKQLVLLFRPVFSTSVLSLTITKNTGSLWSLFGSQSWANLFFIVVSILVLGLLAYLCRQYPEHRIGFLLAFAGGVGNLIDRFRFGGVIDFIHVHGFPIFNIADMCVSIGVLIVLVQLIREKPVRT